MSPLQVLVLPDALHSPNQGRIRPGCPLAGSRTAPGRHNRNSSSLFSFFFCSTTVTHFLKISPSQPPPLLIPLSYSLPVVHSVTVCFTLDRPLSHSLRPASIIYLSSIAVSFSFAAFLSLVNSSFSQLSSLSAHSLYLPSVLSLHLNCFPSSRSLFLSHYLLL